MLSGRGAFYVDLNNMIFRVKKGKLVVSPFMPACCCLIILRPTFHMYNHPPFLGNNIEGGKRGKEDKKYIKEMKYIIHPQMHVIVIVLFCCYLVRYLL